MVECLFPRSRPRRPRSQTRSLSSRKRSLSPNSEKDKPKRRKIYERLAKSKTSDTPEESLKKVQDWKARQQSILSYSSSQYSVPVVIIPKISIPRKPTSTSSHIHSENNSKRNYLQTPRNLSQDPESSRVNTAQMKGKERAISQSRSGTSSKNDQNPSHPTDPLSKQSGDSVENDNDDGSSESTIKIASENPENIDLDLFNLKPEELELLQLAGKSVKVPSWLTRLPKSVGMPAAGTPKAAEWLILYTIHIVLVLIPKWKLDSENQLRESALISTTSKLIRIINLVMSQKIDTEGMNQLDQLIVDYRKSLSTHWGLGIEPKPTLHYSHHMSELIKLYGPPSVFSCWSGERLNHILTLVKKNKNTRQFIYNISLKLFFVSI